MLEKRESGFPATEKERRTTVLLQQRSTARNPWHINTGARADHQVARCGQLLFAPLARRLTSPLAGAPLSVPSCSSGGCTERAAKGAGPRGPVTRQTQGQSGIVPAATQPQPPEAPAQLPGTDGPHAEGSLRQQGGKTDSKACESPRGSKAKANSPSDPELWVFQLHLPAPAT